MPTYVPRQLKNNEFTVLEEELEEEHNRRDGFEEANADKIFESTYHVNTLKPTIGQFRVKDGDFHQFLADQFK